MAEDGTGLDLPEAALEQANLNAVRMALWWLTGDPELATMKVDRVPVWGGTFFAHLLCPEDQAIVKDKALAYLRGRPTKVPPGPGPEEIREDMERFAGAQVDPTMARFGWEEMGLVEFPRGVEWNARPSDEDLAAFHVVVIGAGIGGLAAAVQLERLGVPYTVVERQEGIGGTWQLNDYLDSRVDLPGLTYSFSFMQNYPWRSNYPPQAEVKEYLQCIADSHGVTPRIRLGCEVVSAKWHEGPGKWEIRARARDGSEEMFEANVVISAAGLFSTPHMPDIPGAETFRGKMFHTTSWDHSFDICGKRAALIGNGSTGTQLMPELAERVGHLTIFQRTAGWMAPVDAYKADIPPAAQWLYDNLPYYWNWCRFAYFQSMTEDADGLMTFDPAWQAAGGIVSRRNDEVREFLTAHLQERLQDRPDLLDKCMPDYVPWARRMIVDSGWYQALKRPDVELVTEGIECITPDGVRTMDGSEYSLDLIVLAAGFEVNKFLWPARYEGRNGVSVEQAWKKEGPRAYFGMTMPDFPNFFMIYGPNSQTRFAGLYMWLEVWARYAVKGVTYLLEHGQKAMEVRREVFRDYNAKMDEELRRLVSNDPSHGGYYFNKEVGRPGVSSPWVPDYIHDALSQIRPSDYIFTPGEQA